MKFKEMYNNPELLECLIEDIEEIPEDTEVTYAVFALGYTKDDDCTDDEVLVGEFENPDEALVCAEKVTLEMINELGFEKPDPDTAYFSIEVETVVPDLDDEDGGTMNLGSLYTRELWIDGDYGDEEDIDFEENSDPVVELQTSDFEITEDGLLKVSCNKLKDFNKNDLVRVLFIDEAETSPFLYKIISKVIYADGDYYHCDLQL